MTKSELEKIIRERDEKIEELEKELILSRSKALDIRDGKTLIFGDSKRDECRVQIGADGGIALYFDRSIHIYPSSSNAITIYNNLS